LLSERVPEDGRILVLGAGGGQELKALAQAHAGWSFDGVDPSAEMLSLAKHEAGAYASRIGFHEGYIGNAPRGPFDAATAILIFHFIPIEQRLETLRQILQRLKVGAPLVTVHLSFPQSKPERALGIARHLAFASMNDAGPPDAVAAQQQMSGKLTLLSPEDEVKMLHEAGFAGASLFYAGLSLKGWVSYAA
jgi:tRNA (cmo5U34)-methyltransferase